MTTQAAELSKLRLHDMKIMHVMSQHVKVTAVAPTKKMSDRVSLNAAQSQI